MSAAAPSAAAAVDAWADAWHAAALLAVDPVGLGGIVLRAAPDARREAWLAALQGALPADTPWRRMPLHIDDDRLLGGVDLGATLQAGRLVAQPGLLARCDGGVLLAAMAERLSPAQVARLCAVLDVGEVRVQRDGLAQAHAARLSLVALDEGHERDESVAPALTDRLALRIDLTALPAAHAPRFSGAGGLAMAAGPGASASPVLEALVAAPGEVLAARARLPTVQADAGAIGVLCEAALALGVDSLRAPLLALRLARAAAALDGRDAVDGDDLALAARLVLAPRATRLPAAEAAPEPEPPPEDAAEPPPPPPPDAERDDTTTPPDVDAAALQDQVLQAALAAIPPGLLAQLLVAGSTRSGAGGRAGALQASRRRGRPYGSRRGDPRQGARLHLIDTLRAAAPWQLLRRREEQAAGAASAADAVAEARAGAAGEGPAGAADRRVRVRRGDFHVARHRERRETTTIFVVDASGSAALHRLAEAKGAVELLLAECYVRRDRVALVAFRAPPGGGPGAELLLPPTRSLVRAKRSLAALPGGGGTPLASGLDAARTLAEDVARRGGTPVVVLLTDGRANIARDGSPGRGPAHDDALASARLWPLARLTALWLDTSPQPQAVARQLAQAMGARYLPLPHADARQVSAVVSAARP